MESDKENEQIEDNQMKAELALQAKNRILHKENTWQHENGMPSENFFKKHAMYRPREIVPQWAIKVTPNYHELLEKVARSTNPRIAKYLQDVRRLRGEGKYRPPESVTEDMVYKLDGRTTLKLPMVRSWEDNSCCARKYMIGRPTKTEPQRNILVIGTKDSGKSTLIDCLANYTLGVEWEDNFTLRITDPEENDNPHRLKWINVYTIPSTTNTVLPFAVNVVDVSGFSKVRPSRLDDKDVVDNLKKFMQNPVAHEVDNFSSVWFVHSAKDTTVSPMYQHIYNELVQMYGNDIHTKIKTFVTHTSKNDKVFVKKSVAGPGLLDGSEMSVRNMIAFNRMSETPYSNAAEVGANLKGSWSDNLAIMANLSEEVANEKPMSIFITPKNLERREKVTEGFRQLNNLLRIGCQRLQVMYQEKHAIEEKVSPEEIIAQVPDFEYKIQEPVKVIEKSPYCGEEVTNCSVCFVTCHSKCSIRKDEDKRRCWAMTDGYCRICPGKCYWDQHFNRAFQLFVRMEQKTKKFSDLPGEYKVDGNEKTSVLLKALAESSDEAKMYVEGTLEKATRNLQVIDEMSGRKVSTQSECIDVIIHEEMRDGMPDWENRVKILKMLKNEGRLGIRIKGKEHTEKLL